MRHLFLILLVLSLAACKTPEVVELTPTQEMDSATIIPTTRVQPTLVAIPPTPQPKADYRGISFRYDESLYGTLQEAVFSPAQASGELSAQPEHVSFTFSGSDLFESSEVQVYPVGHYELMSDTAAAHISHLEEMFVDKPVQPPGPLPLYPWPETVAKFESDPTYVNFENGVGISFIGDASSGDKAEFVYAFQGITGDGRYLVTSLVPLAISYPDEESTDSADASLTQVSDQRARIEKEITDAQNNLTESFRTLEIRPQNDLAAPAPAAYISYPGILMAYAPELSGNATAGKKLPIFTSDDGKAIFLSGVPDAIHVAFEGSDKLGQRPVLHIQPLRGATGQYYASIPAEQKQLVEEIEKDFNLDEDNGEVKSGSDFGRYVAFQNGLGKRYVGELVGIDQEEQLRRDSYQYRGVTSDGRYFVQFSHPLAVDGTIEEAMLNSESIDEDDFFEQLAQLDQMIQSLVIDADASTDSTMPVNELGCTLDAQFVKDITIPDHTVVERGHAVRKTWRVRNTGTCTWTPAYQIQLAGGNPISWGKPSVVDVVAPGEDAEISVEIISPENPGNYQAWWQLADEMGNEFGPFFNVLFESPRPATEIPGYGVMEGEIGYPASGIPAVVIYFARTDGSQRFALETEEGWSRYANELPVGDYYVFARVAGDESDSGGGYTEAVKCDMTCDEHNLLTVTIEEGKATREVDILDWYAPAGTFPLP